MKGIERGKAPKVKSARVAIDGNDCSESDRLYCRFMRSGASQSALLVDRMMRVQDASDGFLLVHRLRREGVVDIPLADLFGQKRFEASLRGALEMAFTGVRMSFSSEGLAPGAGNDETFVSFVRLIPADENPVSSVYICFDDMTELVRMRQELVQSERKYRMLFDFAQDGILLTDKTMNIIESNDMAQQMLGFSHQTLKRMNYVELLDSAEARRFPVRLGAVLQGGVVRLDRLFRRENGTTFTAEVCASLIDDELVQVLVRDVSTLRERNPSAHLEEDVFSLRAMLGRCVQDGAGKASRKGLDVYADVDSRVPDAMIGDSARLSDLLQAIVRNSVDLSISGGVRVRAGFSNTWDMKTGALKDDEEQGRTLMLEFSVRWAGAECSRTNGSRQNTDSDDISLARERAQQLGGDIWIETEQDSGCTLFVRVPLRLDRESLAARSNGEAAVESPSWNVGNGAERFHRKESWDSDPVV